MDSKKKEKYIDPVFVCTFCKHEFPIMSSLFCHMNELHETELKNL